MPALWVCKPYPMAGEMDEFEALLVELRKKSWTQHKFGDPPVIVSWTYQHGDLWDAILLWGADAASGYRSVEPFNPQAVCYQYHSNNPVHTIRAMLSLPPPGHIQAPVGVYKPQKGCWLPANMPNPMAMRRL